MFFIATGSVFELQVKILQENLFLKSIKIILRCILAIKFSVLLYSLVLWVLQKSVKKGRKFCGFHCEALFVRNSMLKVEKIGFSTLENM